MAATWRRWRRALRRRRPRRARPDGRAPADQHARGLHVSAAASTTARDGTIVVGSLTSAARRAPLEGSTVPLELDESAGVALRSPPAGTPLQHRGARSGRRAAATSRFTAARPPTGGRGEVA